MIRIIEKDGNTKDYEQSDIYALQTLRHTGSHIMADAIKRLYPNAKLAIGPFIENGFYYDIDFGDIKISDEDFPKIEDEMKRHFSHQTAENGRLQQCIIQSRVFQWCFDR